MSDIFPKWTNRLPLQLIVAGSLLGLAVVAGVTYYFTPKFTRVGYQPAQPVPFSHAVHAGQLGLDCRYCHHGVEKSWYSNVPSASVCMNCHNQVLREDPRLAPVRESFESGKPLAWIQVHKLPDYVYFNHAVHVNRGVSCVECHGPIHEMDEVYHAKPLSMAFCLSCHRNPAEKLRPLERVTDLDWTWSEDKAESRRQQRLEGAKLAHNWKVESLVNCSACHR